MSDRQMIVPETMQLIPERVGYVPALKVGNLLFCSGQIGRTAELEVIVDPEQQFVAAWENLKLVLAAGGCGFEDVVELTTYHVAIDEHMELYKKVRDRLFPRATCAWTAIGISALAHPALLLEIKCVAVQRAAL